MTYSLMLNTSVVDGTPVPIQNITGLATGWRRWTDWLGGYDVGEFTVYADPFTLLTYFETWLRLDVTEEIGGLVLWNGEIRKMDFIQGNMPKSVDFNECYNRVRCSYGTGGDFTAYATNDYSISKFGRRSETLFESCDTLTDAEEERDYFLKKHGWPPLIAARDMRQGSQPAHLKVYVMGYKYSINDKPSPSIAVSDSIATALTTAIGDAYYVSVRSIGANTNAIVDDNDKERGWDFIERLLKMSDSSSNLFHGWIDENRKFTYQAVDLTPTYYVRGGRVFTDSGTSMEMHSRWLAPGIYRDMDSLLTGANRGGLLQDRNDFLVERVMVDEAGNLGFSSGDAYDFMTMLRANAGAGGGDTGGDSNKPSKWRWKYMSDAQKAWWIGGRVGPAPP